MLFIDYYHMRIFVVAFLACSILLVDVHAKTNCEHKLQQCENKKPLPHKPVCGNDHQTYTHRCILLKIQCTQNPHLTVKYKGRCRGRQPCWLDLAKKINENKNKTSGTDYIPECLSDGTYSPMQCHKSIGYCWCVTPDGKMVPGTTARHKKLECPVGRILESTYGKEAVEPKNSTEHDCDETNKNMFINNLVRIFKTEYNREIFSQLGSFVSPNATTSLEEKAIRWKFSTLDKDTTLSLQKHEYRELRQLVRKVVNPKKCARIFIRLCDMDQNSVLSKEEWMSCLNVTYEKEAHETPVHSEQETVTVADIGIDVDEEFETSQNNSPTDHDAVGKPPLNSHPILPEDEDDKANDCFSDRKAVMDELRVANQEMYIPECSPDGRYKKIQCFHSTGYCWCVLEDSGRPIPGTSVIHASPKCDVSQHVPRLIKGCSETMKLTFIKNLLEFFHQNLTTSRSESGDQDVRGDKGYEHASLGFHSLDTNKNEFLDRKEWKLFRAMMSTNKTMKRCGRKFPRYCDSNRDDRITKMEWFQCLNLPSSTLSIRNTHHNLPRGPNPIDAILKDY